MGKRRTQTSLIELAETHNMALAIQRIKGNAFYDDKWKRALYHAVQLADVPSGIVTKIRIALELP